MPSRRRAQARSIAFHAGRHASRDAVRSRSCSTHIPESVRSSSMQSRKWNKIRTLAVAYTFRVSDVLRTRHDSSVLRLKWLPGRRSAGRATRG
jgi:hypothetical protein